MEKTINPQDTVLLIINSRCHTSSRTLNRAAGKGVSLSCPRLGGTNIQRHISLPTTSGTGPQKRAVKASPTNKGQNQGFPLIIHNNMNPADKEGPAFCAGGGWGRPLVAAL